MRYARRTARILLLDGAGRILLMRFLAAEPPRSARELASEPPRSARELASEPPRSARELASEPPRSARPDLGHVWVTPGGGVRRWERLRAAAARELREETGLVVAARSLGPVVALGGGYADLGWAKGMFRDDFFCYRVDSHDVDTSGFSALERRNQGGHQWWTTDELRSTTETVYPLGLAALVEDLFAGRVPAQPVRLPWHH